MIKNVFFVAPVVILLVLSMKLLGSLSSNKTFVTSYFIALLIVLGYVFHYPISIIIEAWSKEEYSHAVLVPFISVYLILHVLAKEPMVPRVSMEGNIVVVAGVIIHLLGVLTGIRILPQYGFFIVVLGLLYTLFGRDIFLKVKAALVFLFFAIPLPTTFYITLSSELQLISSSIGAMSLNFLGYSVYREGNIIDLGEYQLQVVEACSGLRYIFPLLSFSYLVAYIFKDALWKRAIVFLSAIPLAAFLNVVRITITGIVVGYWGPAFAEGALHDFVGLVIFAVCLPVFLFEVFVLSNIGRVKGGLDFSLLEIPKPPFFLKPVSIDLFKVYLFCFFVFFSVGQATNLIAPIKERAPIRKDFVMFPHRIGEWKGTFSSLQPAEIELLRVSDYVTATYVKEDLSALPVQLYVAYYQSLQNENNIHSPEMCLPGSGWETISLKTITLKPTESVHPFSIVRNVISKGNATQIVYYWFEQAGFSTASNLRIKAETIYNSLFNRRSDSALIRVSTPITPNQPESQADEQLKKFIEEVYPVLADYVPDIM